jgi:hypothetical protein
VFAPVAVKVTLPDTHTEVGKGVAVRVGVGFTTKATVEGAEQDPLFPVTVYVVLTEGDTVTLAPVNEPGIQV